MLNVGKNLKLSVCKSYLDLGILTLMNENLTISLYANILFLALVLVFIVFFVYILSYSVFVYIIKNFNNTHIFDYRSTFYHYTVRV